MANEQKQNKKMSDLNQVVAGVTGAAIGLGIGVAGTAAILNNKKNQEKVKKVLNHAKNQVNGYIDDMHEKKLDKKSKVIKKLPKAKK